MHTDAHLVEAAKQGDRGSRDRLLVRALPTIRSIAARYRDFGLPLDDLVQEGSLGLLEAIDRYEPDRSADFDAYARFRIRRAIRDALTSQSRLIRLPKQIVERRRSIERATADLETATVADEELHAIDRAVATLPERQRTVVTRRFGFGCEPQDIVEVAASLHVSPQRVRAIERNALYALHDALAPIVGPRATSTPARIGAYADTRSGIRRNLSAPRPGCVRRDEE